MREHSDFIEEQIRHADGLILEDAVVFERTAPRFAPGFFESLADIAADEGLPVYVLDETQGGFGLVSAELLQLCVGLGMAGTNATSLALAGLLKKPMSRREFLKKGAFSLLGAMLALGTTARGNVDPYIPRDAVLDDVFTYGSAIDYRNIVMAENLTRLGQSLDTEKWMPYVMGTTHVNGVYAYLKNPALRSKLALYLPQEMLLHTGVRRFERTSGRWELVESF